MPESTDDSLAPQQVARIAHLVDARVLLSVLPHLDHTELDTIRRDFARWVGGSARTWGSWVEAWNAWSGATPRRPGTVSYYPTRCGQCRGKRIDMRRGRICHECLGRGRPTRPQQQTVLHLTEHRGSTP